jgi:2-hydroxychromene-2-carboxylate isomerase
MKTIEFFYDYASPWSYLAEKLAPRVFEGLTVVRRPTYLRAFETFAGGVPYSAAKMQYLIRDLTRCAEHEGIPLAPPASFPVHGLYGLRGALVAEKEESAEDFARYNVAVFDATWRDSREVSKKETIAEIARELGLPRVAAGLDEPWVKAELKARSDAALARGLFGVPSFVVGDELFWGHDRMDYVRRAAQVG